MIEVEKLVDGRVLKEHICTENYNPNDLRILKVSQNTDWKNDVWQFFNFRFSSEADVIAGEAEQVGEVIHSSMFAINYCPFCGAKLDCL